MNEEVGEICLVRSLVCRSTRREREQAEECDVFVRVTEKSERLSVEVE